MASRIGWFALGFIGALAASYGNAAQQTNPLPVDEANLLAGARKYSEQCSGASLRRSLPPPPNSPGRPRRCLPRSRARLALRRKP